MDKEIEINKKQAETIADRIFNEIGAELSRMPYHELVKIIMNDNKD